MGCKKNLFSIISLGCPKNQVDSEKLITLLQQNGFILSKPENAHIILINTCCFIEDAKKESIETIFDALSLGKKLIVLGCFSERYKQELENKIPEADYFFGVNDHQEILEKCRIISRRQSSPDKITENSKKTRNRLNPHHYAYLKISEGCNRRCSFCIIPKIRGPYKSFDEEYLIKESEGLAKDGVKELILVAQETSYYGRDLERGHHICRLLKHLSLIDGIQWIRLLYIHPASLSEELLETMRENRKIVNYIDIPLQHCEEKILKAMRRIGNRKDYLRLIKMIRDRIPDVVLRTSLMTGFPGESEKEFDELLSFIQEVEFDRLGIFTYSREYGTDAANLKKQLPEKLKQKRMEQLMEIQAHISYKKNKNLIGTKHLVLVDEVFFNSGEKKEKEYEAHFIGRVWGQTPDVDGITLIKSQQHIRAGDFVDVRIIGATEYDLEGVITNTEHCDKASYS